MTQSEPRKGTSSGEASKAYSLVAIPAQPFDKYTLIGKLGHGGMAEVNLGVAGGQGGFRKLTVIKRLHRHLSMEPGFVEMFLDEARLAAKLNHPHCVQTMEVGEYEGNHFLSMEYLDGQGLERLLRMSGQMEEAIPWDLAARIVSDALDGLGYAHELADFDGTPLGVVHRDISPQNIFVTYTGMVKLLDFGIAKAATHVVETKTGVIKGKYAYMAPEQALGGTLDHRADIWSMGVVLWEVITGRRLFKSVNELATLHETLQGEIKLPSAFRPGLPTELDTICMRALTRELDQRYQTAQEMKDELDRYLLATPNAPGRKDISRMMKERFAEVILVHKSTLAHCLEGSGAVMTQSTLQRIIETTGHSQSLTGQSLAGQSLTGNSLSGLRPGDVFTPTPTPPPVMVGGPPPPSASPAASEPKRGGGWFWKVAVVAVVVLLAAIVALLLPIGQDDTRVEMPVEPPPIDVGTAEAEPTEVAENAEPVDVAVETEPVVEPTTDLPGEVQPPPVEDEVIAAADPEPPTPRQRVRRVRPNPTRNPETAPEPAPPTASQEAGSGFLTLATTPWTNVSLGGRDLGTTPLIRHPLPAGTHTLRLTNPEQGINETYRVTIAPGESVSRRLGLR